ncbi:MAG TPA: phosphoglycerate mutase family protein [Vicinamibacterales bacterium]
MRRALWAFAAALLVTVTSGVTEAEAQRAIFLVRHAEKASQTEDPPLSAEGMMRARALADLLRGAGVTHIITTEYLRTRATSRPLASRLSIEPEVVPARDTPALVKRIRELGPDAVVLVVGHSNTLPGIMAALGYANTIDLHDRDYDDVFVLVPRGEGTPSMVRLKYGRRTS